MDEDDPDLCAYQNKLKELKNELLINSLVIQNKNDKQKRLIMCSFHPDKKYVYCPYLQLICICSSNESTLKKHVYHGKLFQEYK